MRDHVTQLFILGALALVGIVLLAMTGHEIPTILVVAATAAISGGTGAALPNGGTVKLDDPVDVRTVAPKRTTRRT